VSDCIDGQKSQIFNEHSNKNQHRDYTDARPSHDNFVVIGALNDELGERREDKFKYRLHLEAIFNGQ
jgi:hypothetical protein